tara:strand:- start:98 stop:598 length:501 start_codon:yes stop_codon:yes gene_type:complete
MPSEEKVSKIDTATKPFIDELHQEMISGQRNLGPHQSQTSSESSDSNSVSDIRIIEVEGTSQHSWEDAARHALRATTQHLPSINGIEIVRQTATVKNGTIKEYRSTVQLHYQVKHNLDSQTAAEQSSTTNADELPDHHETAGTHMQQDIAKHYQDVQKLDRRRSKT